MTGAKIGFVTGLAVEADVLRRNLDSGGDAALIACAGANAQRAGLESERLVEAGAVALVSYGIAGGLDPGLEPGTVVLADAVVPPGQQALPTHKSWREVLLAAAPGDDLAPVGGAIAGSDRAVSSVADKEDLQAATGAVAVDMESHAVAQVARDAGLPLLVIRAIADPAGRPLPKAVLGSIGEDGRPRSGLVALRLAYRPWEVPRVDRLRRDARRQREAGEEGLLDGQCQDLIEQVRGRHVDSGG